MDFTSILQAIATVGFPIIACIGIAWFFNRVNENYRTDIKELSKQHQDEMKAMTEAVSNNTLALQRLVDKLDADERAGD